jgi:hypothetical protein
MQKHVSGGKVTDVVLAALEACQDVCVLTHVYFAMLVYLTQLIRSSK